MKSKSPHRRVGDAPEVRRMTARAPFLCRAGRVEDQSAESGTGEQAELLAWRLFAALGRQ